LSKELGIQSKELMNFVNKLGANVRNHMSTIDDNFVEQARQAFPAVPKQSRIPQFMRETPVETTKPPAKPVVDIPKALPKKESIIPIPKREHEYPEKERPFRKPEPPAGKPAHPGFGDFSRPKANFPRDASQPASQRGLPIQGGFNRRPASPQTGSKPYPGFNRPSGKPGNTFAKDQKQTAPGKTPYQPGRRPGNVSDSKRAFGHQPAPRRDIPVEKPSLGHPRSKPAGNQGFIRSEGRFAREQPQKFPPAKPVKPQGPITSVKSVQVPDSMTVKDFSQLIEVPASDVIKKLIGLGVMATINQEIDRDTMTLIAHEYVIIATAAPTEEQKLQVEEIEDDPKSLVHRPPIVTIMGHVDHGKTSLLDAIRETNVTASEAGGITQHIGAYQVELNDRKITFLDTPGHEAFTAMRARGAQVTDVAVLVVAADDGVMPQTIEALNHAKDANVSIIVAINKIDKPGADPERVKTDLTEYSLVSEEWGGDTIFVPVSAKKRVGIENLLEMILLVADVKDLKANPNRPAKGTIIEAQLDKGHGPVATVLVQNGTLELSDSIIAGTAVGRVRALINDKGKRLKKAGPSTPVEVIGFNELPGAGDIMYVITEDRLARALADKRTQFKWESELKKNQKITLDDLFTKIKEGEIKELKIIIKTDVHGSVEAIRHSLERLSNSEVRVKVIHGGVGGIGEGDVMLASASNAIIIGFNVRPDPIAKRIAEKEKVDIRLYRIIYNIIEDVQKAMEGMLSPQYKEVVNGRAEIRVIYKVPKAGNVAGCYVLEGKITRNNEIRLIRDNIVIHEGRIESLKRFKDDAREVTEGFECGIGIEKFGDIKEGDIIEAFSMEEIKRVALK
jgi:translation initiation factor IF-2